MVLDAMFDEVREFERVRILALLVKNQEITVETAARAADMAEEEFVAAMDELGFLNATGNGGYEYSDSGNQRYG